LGCYEFETGFPIDFGAIRAQLGPEVTIHGGPDIMLLRDGTPAKVAARTRQILESGVLEGGKFVLREGNNLASRTPFENLDAMYQTARSYA
jgi:uroporphyrinogen-III decarboxylase